MLSPKTRKIFDLLFVLPGHCIRLTFREFLTGDLKEALKKTYRAVTEGLQLFITLMTTGKNLVAEFPNRIEWDHPSFLKLQKRCLGLHQQLASKNQHFFSVLIPVFKPSADFFRTAVMSALSQTAPRMEVLLGLDGDQPPEVHKIIDEIRLNFPQAAASLKVYQFTKGGISRTTNQLAEKAQGNYLLLMDHDDWIRPDLLFRYDQILHLEKSPDVVLYCDEFCMDEKGRIQLHSVRKKIHKPVFPFLFMNYICHCLLIPKKLWEQANLDPETDGAQDFDLCLKLSSLGAQFKKVPAFLYAWRTHRRSTANNSLQKPYAWDAGVKALTQHCNRMGLNWKIEKGFVPTSYKATPELKGTSKIHVIVPFHDQIDLTCECIKRVLQQEGVHPYITAVDNNSRDSSTLRQFEGESFELMPIAEPFNYSHLNNEAVRNTRFRDIPYLLFLNNDVLLDPGALLAMARWIQMNQIGVVGAHLRYPQGGTQHAGIRLSEHSPLQRMLWEHEARLFRPTDMGLHQVSRTVDAVTAACAMIRRQLFLEVDGFDEIFFPIAYSDTDLCTRVRKKGYHIFYCAEAKGVHQESATRGFDYIEDFEMSSALSFHLNRFPPDGLHVY